MRVSLVILALNEIEGMKAIMPRIKREWCDELIIADGGSTDGTVEYAREQGYPVFVSREKGFDAGFKEAMEKVSGDIIIVFSPDGNSIPERIPDLVKKMEEGYDMVIVSRYLNGAKSYDDDMVTAFGNHMFTALINLLFKSNITDSLVMYRAYKKSLLDELKINTNNNITCGSQILLRTIKRKKKIGEIPGDEPPRIGGIRKMQPLKNGLIELTKIIKEFFVKGY